MTVTSTNQKVTFNGDGSTTVFAYNYKIFAQTDLLVILRVTATGTETKQFISTNYSVSGVGTASGGNVTMGTAPASGTTLTILRVQPNLQGLDLVPNDPFPAGNLEASLDKLTFMVQTHEEEIGRSIKASKANTISTTEFSISASDRANKVFSFDSLGDLNVTQELGTFRGSWAASTAYVQRDLVKDTTTNNIFIAKLAHTSSGSEPITTNTDAAKWALLLSPEDVVGNLVVPGDLSVGDDVKLTSDAAVLGFGVNNDVTLTHVHDTGLLLNGTRSLQFNDASQFINAPSATVLDINATDEIELNATLIDVNGNLDVSGTITLGSGAVISEAELEMLDGITAGTVAASKAVVVDANKDASSFRNLTATGAVTAGSLVIGSADIAEAELEMLDGITAGTVAASKAVVVDANKDASSFRNLTASGAVTAGSLVIGSADIAEAELEMIDGITAGTALASKAMVLDSAKDITGGRNLTISGELDAATGDFSGIVDVAGALTVSNTTASSSSTTGSLIVGGGVGIAADLFVGDDFDVTGDAVIDGTTLATGIITATAKAVFNGGFGLPDSQKATFGGTGTGDLQIYHDGSNSFISDQGDGQLVLLGSNAIALNNAANTENMLVASENGSVDLYHNNSKRIETTATGVTVVNPAEDSILQINAATANKNSILAFGDGADGDVGKIDYDHNNNEMIFSANAAVNSFSMTATKGFFVYDTFQNWGSSNFDITMGRGRYLERMGNMADDAKIRVFVGSYTYHGGSIEYQIRDGGGTQNIVGGGVIYYSTREAEPNATIVGTNTSTKIVVTGAASGDTYADGKFTFALRATNGDSHITINNRLGSQVNMSLKFNIQYQG